MLSNFSFYLLHWLQYYLLVVFFCTRGKESTSSMQCLFIIAVNTITNNQGYSCTNFQYIQHIEFCNYHKLQQYYKFYWIFQLTFSIYYGLIFLVFLFSWIELNFSSFFIVCNRIHSLSLSLSLFQYLYAGWFCFWNKSVTNWILNTLAIELHFPLLHVAFFAATSAGSLKTMLPNAEVLLCADDNDGGLCFLLNRKQFLCS